MATAAEVQVELAGEASWRARRFHYCHRLLVAAALPRALLLYLRLRLRSPAGIRWLRACGHSPWRAVYRIAAGRLVRRALRTGCTPSPAVIWPSGIPPSCVVAFFHTPWDLVIAAEARAREYCLVRAGANWSRDLGQQHVRWDRAGLKSLVRSVAGGARCAVAADNFVTGSKGGVFGTLHALNPAAVRLAAATRVPLVTIWPVYERGVLRLRVGAPIAAATCAERPLEALRIAQEFFENAVRGDPGGWPRIVSFLEHAIAASDGARKRASGL
jgi:hypothetical protein